METKKSKRFWVALLLFSLTGQVAWVMENMYLNVFIYKIFSADASDISLMVGASAVMATLTTVLIGALSDRIGKRKVFICGGYILWGISILAFSLIRLDVIHAMFPMAVSAASAGVALVIIVDCIMTFFGSSANDAAFNAWMTDSTNEKNRGTAEGLNAMMPLIAVLVVFGGFMFLNLDLPESWTLIFTVIGVAVIAIGILGIFLIQEPTVKPSSKGYWKSVLYGFSPTAWRDNRRLYICFAAFTVFNISIQIFMPYLIIYYEVSLGMTDYALIMAPAILLASVVTAFWGRVYDKKGFRLSALCPLVLLIIGYGILYLFREALPVFVGSFLMMSGYLAGAAAFGAKLREQTPEGKAGQLQGIRIFTQVLIPGIVGPFIGKLVLADAETIVGGDGTLSFIPSADIFSAAAVPAIFIFFAILFFFKEPPKPHNSLKTPYGVGEFPYDEHPDPMMKRDSFVCLNGAWNLKIYHKNKFAYDGKITVPFPPESELSGVERITKKQDILVYERTFAAEKQRGHLLLHFGASDNQTEVLVNGISVGIHTGGYLPFTVDITSAVRSGENILTVKVTDPLDKTYPYGKQRHKRGGMWYTPVSGLWQTVWLEQVPKQYIKSLRITPTQSSVTVEVEGGEDEKSLLLDGRIYPFRGNRITVEIDDPKLWTPETPNLYFFTLESGEDRVSSYFALRQIGIDTVNGRTVLTLNGKPYFFHGLLDQGYYPDGIFLPPSEDGFRDDILRMKELGFNMLRKHIKIEPKLFYYYCDLYGMAVFQDMVNNGHYSFFYDTALPTVGLKNLPRRENKRTREVFCSTAKETLEHLYNHPSVVYYTIFNEGWGQHNAKQAYQALKPLDQTRIFDTASGWFGREPSDVQSEHVYFKKADFKLRSDRPVVLSEFGGYSCNVEGHIWNPHRIYGYKICPTTENLTKELERLYAEEIVPLVQRGMSAAVLTQVSDVEDETNGMLTYDRQRIKVDPQTMQRISQELQDAFQKGIKTE